MSNIDTDIDMRVLPRFPKLLLPSTAITIRTPTIRTKMPTATRPWVNTEGSIPPRVFTMTAMSNIATDIFISVFPNVSKLFPANLVIRVSRAITPTNPAKAANPFIKDSVFILPRIFITTAINNIATAIFRSIFPS